MLPAIVFLGSLFVIPVTAALLSFWTIASISLITVAIINALALFLMKIRTNSNGVVVTNQRLICTHGLFETDMREIPIGHITNVASHHDFFQRLAGSGTVEVDVGGSLGPEIFPNVADPEGLAELLVHEVDRFESGMTGGALRANGTHDRPRRCPVDELSQLHRLLQEGALSNAEYEQLKAQLLNDSSNGFN
jgi:hypothetical protein